MCDVLVTRVRVWLPSPCMASWAVTHGHRWVDRHRPRCCALERNAQPRLHPTTVVYGLTRSRSGCASLHVQFVPSVRGKCACRLRGQPGHRSAPDGSRFHYLHVSPACAPQLAAWLSKPRLIEPNELSCSTTILAYTKGCTSLHAEPAATGTLNSTQSEDSPPTVWKLPY
jgi:hypothetical protein